MQSLLQVDEEVGAEEFHPELHTSQNQAGARSLQKLGSLSSELASSEQRQGPPKRDLYKEEGRYKPPRRVWLGYTPSPAATAEQSYSGGALDAEANRGRGSSSRQLSSRLDYDMPLFRGPVSSPQGKQCSQRQQQHGHRFDYDREYEYPARHRGDLIAAHPRVQQQHGHENFGDGSEMGPAGITVGPQSNGRVSDEFGLPSNGLASKQQQEERVNAMRPPGYDREEGPPGFAAAPQSNGWGPKPSSSAAASQQHNDGMRPPGFAANPNRGMGMAAVQSGRQQQSQSGYHGQGGKRRK